MALFGHDDDVRRLSGSNRISPLQSPDGEPQSTKCTAARAKSIIKNIFAQLFSHVGLCALVIGYSLMGAVIFVSLEKQNELDTRANVSATRNQTLDELYNITGKIRKSFLKVIFFVQINTFSVQTAKLIL
jgi:hypothetical protein